MSVVSSKLDLDQDYNADDKYVEKLVLSWRVVTDNKNDGHRTVILGGRTAAPHPLPKQFDPYQYGGESNGFLLAKRLQARRVPNSATDWKVVVEYDNTIDPGQAHENPLDREPIDEWDFEQFQRALEKDVDGDPILNPVGQPFDPPVQADDSRPILTYTRNEASFPTQILTYQDAYNSDPFLIFPAKTAKVNIRALKRWENGVRYYQTRYTFHFRYDGWEQEVLNRGTKFKLNASDTEAVSLPPGEKPVLLADDGTITDAANPSYTKIKKYRPQSFGALNIIIV